MYRAVEEPLGLYRLPNPPEARPRPFLLHKEPREHLARRVVHRHDEIPPLSPNPLVRRGVLVQHHPRGRLPLPPLPVRALPPSRSRHPLVLQGCEAARLVPNHPAPERPSRHAQNVRCKRLRDPSSSPPVIDLLEPLHPYLSQHLRPAHSTSSVRVQNRTDHVLRNRTYHVLPTLELTFRISHVLLDSIGRPSSQPHQRTDRFTTSSSCSALFSLA